jgi:hypothetical protein
MPGVIRPMLDRTQLKIGHRIRLLRIPQGDLEHRERELRAGAEDAGWTACGIATNTPPYAA